MAHQTNTFSRVPATYDQFSIYRGATVVLETTDDHTLVLTSLRSGNTSRQQMYSVGVRPEDKKVVVAKGVVSPRPAYEPIAAEIVLVNTPGVTTSDLSFFDCRRCRRPLFPFEEEAAYVGSGVHIRAI